MFLRDLKTKRQCYSVRGGNLKVIGEFCAEPTLGVLKLSTQSTPLNNYCYNNIHLFLGLSQPGTE